MDRDEPAPVELQQRVLKQLNLQLNRTGWNHWWLAVAAMVVLKFDLRHQAQATIIASTQRRDVARSDEYRQAEIKRRAGIVAALPCENELVNT